MSKLPYLYFRKGKQSIKSFVFPAIIFNILTLDYLFVCFLVRSQKQIGSDGTTVYAEAFLWSENSPLYQLEGEKVTCTHLPWH